MKTFAIFIFSLLCPESVHADSLIRTMEINWNFIELFRQSTSHDITQTDAGLVLDNQILIEDDSPAFGYSVTDGVEEIIEKDIALKKILNIEHWPVEEAYIAMLAYPEYPPEPYNGRHLVFTVNGNEDILYELKHFWTNVKIPVEHLRPGLNEIIVRAHEDDSRFKTYVALDEKYPSGSLTRLNHPNRSARSTDNGKTWDFNNLGSKKSVDGEYPIRLKITANKQHGWLESPVIDMAVNSNHDIIRQPVKVLKASLRIQKNTPPDTNIKTYVRTGSKHFIDHKNWSEWTPCEKGIIPCHLLINRYMQFKLMFTTETSCSTPAVHDVTIQTEYNLLDLNAFKYVMNVTSKNNPVIYSSLPFSHEDALNDKLKTFRAQYSLDEVVEGSQTEFEKILKLKTWVAKQWEWYIPDNTYPDFSIWDSMEILAPARNGKPLGGYCLHYAIVFAQACQSFGIPARVVVLNHALWGGHEVNEVWSNDYNKWIMMDANFDTCFLDRETGVPLNSLELHDIFLNVYYPDDLLDRDVWTREIVASEINKKELNVPIVAMIGGGAKSGSLTEYNWCEFSIDLFPYCGGYGFLNTGYIRFLPRSNYYSQQLPMPLNHGRQCHWGWTGYYCWFDSSTPKSQEFEIFTNRRDDLYWNLNNVDFSAEIVKADQIAISITTRSPNFSCYELNVNGSIKTTTSDTYLWNLTTGINHICCRVVDVMGNKGPISYLDLCYLEQ